jgi:hypothetical protein
MANSPSEQPGKFKSEPLAVHEVQYVLVASLIGTILLLIVFALVTSH